MSFPARPTLLLFAASLAAPVCAQSYPARAIRVVVPSSAHSVMALPFLRERCEREGMTIVTGTPQEFSAHIRVEIEKWAKIVKSAGIQPEWHTEETGKL